MVTIRIVLVLAAVIVLALAAFNTFSSRLNLTALGLALWAASTIVP
jgi:hypothetical protein